MRSRMFALDRHGMRFRLVSMVAISVIVSVIAVGGIAVSAFDRAIEPELANRVRLIGSTIRGEIQRALELGIPFEAIAGLDTYLTQTLDDFREVDRISIQTARAEPIAMALRDGVEAGTLQPGEADAVAVGATRFELPIIEGNVLVGAIVIETNSRFVRTRLLQVFIDIVVIILVALVVAMEAALAVALSSIEKPLDRVIRLLREQVAGRFTLNIRPGGLGGLSRIVARFNDHVADLTERLAALPERARGQAAQLSGFSIAEGRPKRLGLSETGDIRIALFLFSISTETAVAFLPLYARSAARPEWMSAEFAAALPLMVYLVATAALAPFAGPIARKYGPRRVFLASVVPSAIALLAMGFTGSLLVVALLRGLMAITYATATIACQTYAIRASEETQSARPFGAFMAVVYGGVFCGSALGGLVAGRFGYGSAFVLGATFAAVSGIAGYYAMNGRAGDRGDADKIVAAAPESRRMPVRFVALLAGVAVPMNASTAVFIWYLTPLMLASAGFGPAEIARVVMLYYLAVILFGPVVSLLSDRGFGPAKLVTAGAIVSAGALASLSVWDGMWAMAGAVVGLGIGHTMIRAPQYALAVRITGKAGRGLDYLRLVERIGALAGLAVVAFAIGNTGPDAMIAAMAYLALAGILFFMTTELFSRARQ